MQYRFCGTGDMATLYTVAGARKMINFVNYPHPQDNEILSIKPGMENSLRGLRFKSPVVVAYAFTFYGDQYGGYSFPENGTVWLPREKNKYNNFQDRREESYLANLKNLF